MDVVTDAAALRASLVAAPVFTAATVVLSAAGELPRGCRMSESSLGSTCAASAAMTSDPVGDSNGSAPEVTC